MAALVVDQTVTCPRCWEPHVVTIDLTDEARAFVDDCHVCCNPMQVRFEIVDGELVGIDVESAT